MIRIWPRFKRLARKRGGGAAVRKSADSSSQADAAQAEKRVAGFVWAGPCGFILIGAHAKVRIVPAGFHCFTTANRLQVSSSVRFGFAALR